MATVLPDFATLVEQVGPAVVNVSVVEKAHQARNSRARGGEDADDPFQEFFRRFGIPDPRARAAAVVRSSAAPG